MDRNGPECRSDLSNTSVSSLRFVKIPLFRLNFTLSSECSNIFLLAFRFVKCSILSSDSFSEDLNVAFLNYLNVKKRKCIPNGSSV